MRQGRISQERRLPAWLKPLWQRFLRQAWFVHPGAHLRVSLSPNQSFTILETAAKPSVNRLHLRKVFSDGRRYFLRPQEKGFIMWTTNKVFWHHRRRTFPSAVLYGVFERIDEQTYVLTMRSHIRFFYGIQALFLPLFMTSMIVFMAWSIGLMLLLIVGLFALSWLSHRLTAQLEAYEMVFFIEKALEDFIPVVPLLEQQEQVIQMNGMPNFAEAWDEFYQQQRK